MKQPNEMTDDELNEAMAEVSCKDCKFFKRRVLPPDDLGICTKAEDFTPARWQKENRMACNEFKKKRGEK